MEWERQRELEQEKLKLEKEEIKKYKTLEGNIVISVGLFGHSGDEEVWDGMDEGTLSKTKKMLDDMHKRKDQSVREILLKQIRALI